MEKTLSLLPHLPQLLLPEEGEAACPTRWEVGPGRAGQGDQEDLIKGRKAEVTVFPKS